MTATATSSLRLNLGCGDKLLPAEQGWTNVDIIPRAGVLTHDLRRPLPFNDGTVEEIFAKHVVEHFTPSAWSLILGYWVRALAPGGRLVLECPDLRRACEKFVYDSEAARSWWHHVIYGDEDMPHKQGFDLPRLRAELEAAGLVVTRIRSWHDDVNVENPSLYYNLRAEAVKP